VGIKEEDLPLLFKLFGKLQRTSQINTHGIGLGLNICKQLVENLGGKIWVESAYGKGTTFHFTFSCTDPRRFEGLYES
jgi:signal transduction histidine kinase